MAAKDVSAAIVSFGLGLNSTDKGFTTQLSSLFQLKVETQPNPVFTSASNK